MRTLVFGDSLVQGLTAYLPAFVTGASITKKGVKGIGLAAGIKQIKGMSHFDVYIIDLGTNTQSVAALESAIASLKKFAPAAHIYWLNFHFPGNKRVAMNAALTRAIGPKFTVVDTATTARLNLEPDKIHLTTAGYKARATIINSVITTSITETPATLVPGTTLPGKTTGSGIGAQIGVTGKGSFAEVKSRVDPHTLMNDVKFNPTSPIVQYKALLAATNNRPNLRGFMVRDPFFQEEAMKGDAKVTTPIWGTQYGFRFLYNPTSFTETLAAPVAGDPVRMLHEATQGTIPTTADTGSGMILNLLLYRGEDLALLAGTNYKDFYPSDEMDEETRIALLTQGTQYDLEYIFRMCNGSPVATWRGNTSDWGALIPAMLIVSVGYSEGSRKMRGRITNLSWTHRLFAPGMVPILTELTINFTRLSDAYYQMDTTTQTSLNGNSTDTETPATLQGHAVGTVSAGRTLQGNPQTVVDYAMTLLGKFNYTDSANIGEPDLSTGLDCAAFIKFIWRHVYPGSIPKGARDTTAQEVLGIKVAQNTNAMKPGDLVFYGQGSGSSGHVAMYIGNGKVIHSGNPRRKQATIENWQAAGGSDKGVSKVRRIMEA